MNNYPMKKPKNATDAAMEVIDMESAETDPQGMYTGKPENAYEVPVQDSDDL